MSDNMQQDAVRELNLIGGDKAKGAKYIAEHPEEFGFAWGSGKLGRGVGKDYVEYNYDFPFIEIAEENVYKFLASFGPALFSESLKGTSIKVKTDRVNRAEYDKNKQITVAALREKLVSAVLLQVITRSGGTTIKYTDAKGNVYASKDALDKAMANQAKIDALEAAQAFLAMAAENGIDSTLARTMAQTQWPLAFEKKAEPETPQDTSSHFDGTNESDKQA